MEGIYLTDEAKKGIQDKITDLEKSRKFWEDSSIKNIGNPGYNALMDSINQAKAEQAISLLQEILLLATILPAEKNWDDVFNKTFSQSYIEKDYPNGVIIKPKK
jgi:hypothetical protein